MISLWWNDSERRIDEWRCSHLSVKNVRTVLPAELFPAGSLLHRPLLLMSGETFFAVSPFICPEALPRISGFYVF
jgi:hypothetical protein